MLKWISNYKFTLPQYILLRIALCRSLNNKKNKTVSQEKSMRNQCGENSFVVVVTDLKAFHFNGTFFCQNIYHYDWSPRAFIDETNRVEWKTTDIGGPAWVDQFGCDFPQSPQ